MDNISYYLNHDDTYYFDESFTDIKNDIINLKDLFDQYRKIAGTFVTHKWLIRYVDEKTKEQVNKHYKTICDDDVYYSTYKRSFEFIRKFIGISGNVIIENITFSKDKTDNDLWKIAVKYSKGLAKIKIPKGVRLVHVSPVEGIKELIPSFRSKVKGKYLYPSKRVFFTLMKDIKANQAGLEGKKLYRYATIKEYTEAYIDPTYNDFGSRAIYIETDSPIPVELFEKKMFSLFSKKRTMNEAFFDNKETKEIINKLIPRESVDSSKNNFSSKLDDSEYKEMKEIFNILNNSEDYTEYKKAFEKLCKFCHIVPNGTIITKHTITGNENSGYTLDVEYSYNNKKISLPSNVALYHQSKVDNISELIPAFRGKSEKGYLYYKPRVYLTIRQSLPKISTDYAFGTKLHTYICMKNIKDVYVDPLLNASINGAVYVEGSAKIPVKKLN